MLNVTRTMIYLGMASLLSACGSAQLVKQTPEWGYEKNAIALHLASDPKLNLFQAQAHSLIVCLYQLRDPNGFCQMIDERDGLPKLLDCSRFDSSVTYAKRLVVQPNQNIVELLDRTEGAKFVGIVAGYYALQKESSTRSYPIPVTEIAKDSALVLKPAKLGIDLNLGPYGIGQAMDVPKTGNLKRGGG